MLIYELMIDAAEIEPAMPRLQKLATSNNEMVGRCLATALATYRSVHPTHYRTASGLSRQTKHREPREAVDGE